METPNPAVRLKATMPESAETTVVHGDYRLGNVLVAREAPARVAAILDWEMATLGDPLADLGYLVATWSEALCDEHPLLLGPVTAGEGFATREELVARYAEQTGRDVSALGRYQAFAVEGLGLLRGDPRALPEGRARR